MIGGLTLAFVSAASWAGLDVVRKQLSASIKPLPLLILLNVALLPIFVIWWMIAGGEITDVHAYAIPGAAALVLQIAANVLFLAAVRASPLSLTIPFLALTPVVATLVGYAILGEQPGLLQLLGIAAVVVGALLLASFPGSCPDHPGPRLLRLFASERGAWMMSGVALCWGVSMVLDKQALRYAALPNHALVQLSGLVFTSFVYLLIRGRVRELGIDRKQLGPLALATVAGALAFGLQLAAVQVVLVSQLEAIKRAVGLTSAIVLGRLVFNEPFTLVKIAAVVVMVAGVAMLMLGTNP